MNPSQEYLKTHERFDRVELKDGTEHELEFINSKIDTIEDKATKKEIEGIKYLFKEGGDLKTVFTTSIVLIQKMSELEYNTLVRITQVKYQENGGIELTTYNVSKKEGEDWIEVGESMKESEDMETIQTGEEPPIVEDDPKLKKGKKANLEEFHAEVDEVPF